MDAEPAPENGARPTPDQYVRVFDLHVEVRRAVRSLDDAFPPYTAEDFQAIYDRAQSVREQANALIAHLDQMRMAPADRGSTWCGADHPGGCSVPDSTGVCELSNPPEPS